MKKALSLFFSLSATLPMMWFQVVPNGQEICDDGVKFNVIEETQSNRIAADAARAKFCATVASRPM